jgi:hypothetical protein
MALAITPPTSNVENSAAPRAPPIAWPIFGNTYANTKISSSGCITVRPMNIHLSLASTVTSRRSSAPNARREDARDDPSVCSAVAVVIRAGPFRSGR